MLTFPSPELSGREGEGFLIVLNPVNELGSTRVSTVLFESEKSLRGFFVAIDSPSV